MVLDGRLAEVDVGENCRDQTDPVADPVMGADEVVVPLRDEVDLLLDGVVFHDQPALNPWHAIWFNGIGPSEPGVRIGRVHAGRDAWICAMSQAWPVPRRTA